MYRDPSAHLGRLLYLLIKALFMFLGHLLPVIPISAFGLLFKSLDPRPIADRLVRAAVVWALVLVGLIEGLSLFRGLTRTNLAVGWSVCLVGIAIYLFQRRTDWRATWPVLPHPRWPLLAIIVTIMIPTLIISLVTLPNTLDGLVYHLSRVDYWIQNHSVEYYPVGYTGDRENEFQPLGLHLHRNSTCYRTARLSQVGVPLLWVGKRDGCLMSEKFTPVETFVAPEQIPHHRERRHPSPFKGCTQVNQIFLKADGKISCSCMRYYHVLEDARRINVAEWFNGVLMNYIRESFKEGFEPFDFCEGCISRRNDIDVDACSKAVGLHIETTNRCNLFGSACTCTDERLSSNPPPRNNLEFALARNRADRKLRCPTS
jgi:hypothetical protein